MEARPLTDEELVEEAGRLAMQSVVNRWGGPFGAVIAQDGIVVARGQNRVLLTGDPTAHAEIDAIRKAIETTNPFAPAISPDHFDESTLKLSNEAGGTHNPQPRARMLNGMVIYTSGEPCPMCLAAIYWARLDACFFGCDAATARKAGFDDSFLYDELRKPRSARSLKTVKLTSDACVEAYEAWSHLSDQHLY